MNTDRQQDAGLDRLLRSTLGSDAPVSRDVCPEADVVAAYAEGGLTARERIALEAHLAACARCQSVLSVIARDAIAGAGSQSGRVPTWSGWLSVRRFRWLVPAGAAAIAIVLYVAVKPEPAGIVHPAPAASAAPEFTVAQQLNQAAPTGREATEALRSNAAPALRNAAEHPAHQSTEAFSPVLEKDSRRQSLDEAEPSTRLREVPPSPAAEVNAPLRAMSEALQPPVTTDLQARADVAAAPAMAAPAMAAQPPAANPTRRPVIGRGSGTMTGVDLDSLWMLSDLIVLARAGSTGKPFLAEKPFDQSLTTTVDPIVPTGFDIVEVLKRKDSVPPDPHLALWQLGGEVEDEQTIPRVPDDRWVRIQPGEACVLFLVLREGAEQPAAFEPVSGPNGIYRLDGERVFIGSTKLPEKTLPTRELLAQLRQRAGTAGR